MKYNISVISGPYEGNILLMWSAKKKKKGRASLGKVKN